VQSCPHKEPEEWVLLAHFRHFAAELQKLYGGFKGVQLGLQIRPFKFPATERFDSPLYIDKGLCEPRQTEAQDASDLGKIKHELGWICSGLPSVRGLQRGQKSNRVLLEYIEGAR